ncbi:hypothetical protein ACFTQ7_21700 [Lysinibacillus sp. NPDC056959]|uniref:hypothetical protein n=1 Tax=Lysinibacillus sp. NPDC056959 TaxID=3345981 RepID=UPI0036351004
MIQFPSLLQSINIDIFSVNTKILFFPKLLSASLRITNAYIILTLNDLLSKRGVDFRSDWALSWGRPVGAEINLYTMARFKMASLAFIDKPII